MDELNKLHAYVAKRAAELLKGTVVLALIRERYVTVEPVLSPLSLGALGGGVHQFVIETEDGIEQSFPTIDALYVYLERTWPEWVAEVTETYAPVLYGLLARRMPEILEQMQAVDSERAQ